MAVSRWGTLARSISIPVPPREAISTVEHVSPAAPMSWIATTAPVCIASRHASSRSFSMNGSPTCTLRSEEHTSELQSHHDLVCRLLLEKKKNIQTLKTWLNTATMLKAPNQRYVTLVP